METFHLMTKTFYFFPIGDFTFRMLKTTVFNMDMDCPHQWF